MKMTRSTYEPPSGGSHTATVTKIADLGTQKTRFGDKPQVRVRFEVEEKDSRGQRKYVSQTFTNSIHPKSNFALFFAKIGKPIKGEDVETDALIGTRFLLKLKLIKVDGKMKVRIESAEPLEVK